MAKFIYLYRGPAPLAEPTPQQSAERMVAFGAWMEKVGTALVDVGSPFGTSGAVRDDGTAGPASDLIGYSIVEADNLAAAKAFTEGLPFLSSHDGTCTVDIFELLSM
ncbi:MAG: YciI family protein [Actinomycetota bacterium]|nr:YciI family protein [Actinomycetota bacterium]